MFNFSSKKQYINYISYLKAELSIIFFIRFITIILIMFIMAYASGTIIGLVSKNFDSNKIIYNLLGIFDRWYLFTPVFLLIPIVKTLGWTNNVTFENEKIEVRNIAGDELYMASEILKIVFINKHTAQFHIPRIGSRKIIYFEISTDGNTETWRSLLDHLSKYNSDIYSKLFYIHKYSPIMWKIKADLHTCLKNI